MEHPQSDPGACNPTTRGAANEAAIERRSRERRSHNLRSFLYGGLRPRRRTGRREGDEYRIFVDWHEPRVLYLALAILMMSCLDAMLTLAILGAGGSELNGLMDWLIAFDTQWFVAVKVTATGLGVILLAVAVNRHFLGLVRVIRILELICLGYVLLMAWELYLLEQLLPVPLSRTLAGWLGVGA